MLQYQRVFLNDNGVEKDLSTSVNNFKSSAASLPIVAAENSAIYIASTLPFNHKYLLMQVVNDIASVISVAAWNGTEWVDAVDIVDNTGGLFTSGIIEWKTDRNTTWMPELDSESVDGVSIVGVYNMYWLRLSFSADINASTTMRFIGHKFADDTSLFLEYPDFNNGQIQDAFETGKTDWDDQHFLAAGYIVDDLQKKNIIKSADQIINYAAFESAAIHKCAEIIYRGLGRAYEDDRLRARNYYKEALNMQFFGVDKNADARLDERERRTSMRFQTR